MENSFDCGDLVNLIDGNKLGRNLKITNTKESEWEVWE